MIEVASFEIDLRGAKKDAQTRHKSWCRSVAGSREMAALPLILLRAIPAASYNTQRRRHGGQPSR